MTTTTTTNDREAIAAEPVSASAISLLQAAMREGLRFVDCIEAFRREDVMAHGEYVDDMVDRAREQWQVDGEIEIEDAGFTSIGDDPTLGCYVMAWVWVDGPRAGGEEG